MKSARNVAATGLPNKKLRLSVTHVIHGYPASGHMLIVADYCR
jgi:hypothetical protein